VTNKPSDLHKSANTFLHDIQTPLFCIEINSKSIEMHLPLLLALYKKALDAGQLTTTIAPEHLDILSCATTEIEQHLAQIAEQTETFNALIKKQVNQAQSSTSQSAIKHKSTLNSCTSGSILLVDDEAIHREIAQSIFQTTDFTLDTSNSGLEALESVKNKSYDLILMDLYMPGMSGLETTESIRKSNGLNQNTPIIGLSNIEPLDEHAFFDAGFSHFLLKPLKLNAFQQRLGEIFSKRKA
jgi:CheY-like chemotaxis protein